MKRDMTTVLRALDNDPVQELVRYDNPNYVSSEETPNERTQHTKKEDITLRSVCIGALTGSLGSDKAMGGDEKLKLFSLALRIQQQDQPDLSAEEVSLLKARIGKRYIVLIVGRAYGLLDPVAEDELDGDGNT